MHRYPVFAFAAGLTAALLSACVWALAPAHAQMPHAQMPQANASCFPTAQLNPRIIPAGFRAGFGTNGLGPVPFMRPPLTRIQGVPVIPGLPNLPRGMVQLSYLGHSSFLLRTPKNDGHGAVMEFGPYVTRLQPQIVSAVRRRRVALLLRRELEMNAISRA